MSEKRLNGIISLRYALALFELAKEQSKLDVIADELNSIVKLVGESDDFSRFVFDGVISKKERVSVIKSLSDSFKISNLMRNFLCILATKGRINLLLDIAADFAKFVAKENGEVWAKVIVANDIDNDQISRIKQIVLTATAMNSVKLDLNIDKNIIGGVVIKIGSVLIDNSVKSKLDRLKNKLNNMNSFPNSSTREVG